MAPSWAGRRVLVTGGEGFIGSHLVERLVTEGAEVRVLSYYNAFGARGWLDRLDLDVEVLVGDVRDYDRVAQAVDGREVVFHLAALIGIPYSYEASESYVQTNVLGTRSAVPYTSLVDVCTRRATPARRHAVATLWVPSTLVCT